MQFADTAKLVRSEVGEITGVETTEDVDDAGLKENGGLGVKEVENGGGTPAGDPVERALESGGPGSGEDRERVAVGG